MKVFIVCLLLFITLSIVEASLIPVGTSFIIDYLRNIFSPSIGNLTIPAVITSDVEVEAVPVVVTTTSTIRQGIVHHAVLDDYATSLLSDDQLLQILYYARQTKDIKDDGTINLTLAYRSTIDQLLLFKTHKPLHVEANYLLGPTI